MLYVTIARISGIILLGIVMYVILLWICGRKVPGRMRRHNKFKYKDCSKSKTRIILIFQLVLILLIMVSVYAIKYMVRGEL